MKTYGVIIHGWCEVAIEAPDPETAERIALAQAKSAFSATLLNAETECEYTEDGRVLAV